MRLHPFAETPQYRQQYEASVGTPGNGLGIGRRSSLTWLNADSGQTLAFDNESELVGITDDVYFADTDDAHSPAGEFEPEYAGPSLKEIGEAFALLTAKQQFVLSRRLGLAGDSARYTQAEVAEAMGITVGAIEFIEARARKALRANVVGLDERLLAA